VAGLERGRAPAARAVGDDRPLVRGGRPADLHEQRVLRIVSRRPIEEDHRAAGPREFLSPPDLIGVAACEAVGTGDEERVDVRPPDCVAGRAAARVAATGLDVHRPARVAQ